MSVSESVQMYLLTIYRLSEEGEVVPANIRLAERLGVSAVSVTEMVRKLHEKGLILKKSRALQLTRDGERIVLNVIRKHRLAERLLVDRLGIPWAHAYDQACKLEHILSDEVADALDEFLGYPTTCPHGQPIPDRAGNIKLRDAWPLASVLAGQQVVIERVKEGSVELVDYLVEVGLWPGQRVTVEQVAPFEGPLLVSVDGKSFPLSREVAGKVAVRPAHPTPGRSWLADERLEGSRRGKARGPRASRVRRS